MVILMLVLDRISCARWDIQYDIATHDFLWLPGRLNLSMNEVGL